MSSSLRSVLLPFFMLLLAVPAAAQSPWGDWPFPDAGLDGESIDKARIQSAPFWFNSRPLFTVAEDPGGQKGIVSLDASLKGKAVLIHFWDYTNAHTLEMIPILSAWRTRYGKDGLVIVGVQAPQFPFAALPRNVAAAIRRLGVDYPVYLDSDFLVWRIFSNRHWPRSILVAPGGQVVDDSVGSNDSQATETAIRLTIGKRTGKVYREPLLPPPQSGRAGTTCHKRSPDLPCGFEQGRLGSPGYKKDGTVTAYTVPAHAEVRQDGVMYPAGAWRATREALLTAGSSPWELRLRFEAVALALVASPPEGANGAEVVVTLDGAPVPAALRGADLREGPGGQTLLALDSPRLYRVIGNAPFGKHEIVLTPRQAGTRLYVFYFDGCE
ncbi:MAG: hypothetical protein Q8R92_10715 [Deltaproteobacteria bacterium]|nr:hypothetical protein [Deltaproteobacteria bacterium]